MDPLSRDLLAAQHYPIVAAVARSLIRSRRACQQLGLSLDDLIGPGEEALLSAATSFDARRGVPFEAWAWRRVKGAMIDATRRRHYREGMHADVAAHDVAIEHGNDARIDRDRARGRVRAAIAKLSPEEYRVVQLRYDEELTLEQVASELGLSIAGVRRVQSRAHERLRWFISRAA